ncbi:hypothetical protein [Chryseobacterium sp. MMS23-Vi53]|uniref:hypothetical protein n=1 Tax=Chryseobacterium sp. MMS23-Vi53 TaxID=3386644 RepID=UPI0039E7FADB
MEKVIKYFFICVAIIGGLLITSAIVFSFMFFNAFGGFDKDYSVEDLKEEYVAKEKEIDDLILYYHSIKSPNKTIEIEFKDDEVLGRLLVHPKNDSLKYYQQWDINVEGLQNTAIGKELGWTENELKTLKEKLDKANCISIEDGEPVKVGFTRSGLGMYSFNVFQNKESNRNKYNDGCQYILVNNKLALEYGGGAIGSQCFPNN